MIFHNYGLQEMEAIIIFDLYLMLVYLFILSGLYCIFIECESVLWARCHVSIRIEGTSSFRHANFTLHLICLPRV